MKEFCLIFMFCLSGITAAGQNGAKNIYPATNPPITSPLPIERSVVGGTTITATYAGGNISKTMEGAFEYACRLWEEKIPTTYQLLIPHVWKLNYPKLPNRRRSLLYLLYCKALEKKSTFKQGSHIPL